MLLTLSFLLLLILPITSITTIIETKEHVSLEEQMKNVLIQIKSILENHKSVTVLLCAKDGASQKAEKIIFYRDSISLLQKEDASNSISSKEKCDSPLRSSFSNTEEFHDPKIIDLVSRAFHQQNLRIPKDVNQKIAEYSFSYEETINEFLDRITNKLRDVTKQQIILNPYGSDFISNLLKLTRDNENKIPSFSQFWYDLARLLFKYALAMRRKFAKNDRLFNKSVENIRDIIIIVNGKTGSSLGENNLQFMTGFDFIKMFKNLVQFEIFDHPQLIELFTSDIVDDEGNLKMTLDEIEQKYCNGNFKKNPLLQMMLIEFVFEDSARKQMLEKRWIIDYENDKDREDDTHSVEDTYFAIGLYCIYSRKGKRECENKVDTVEHLDASYLSQSTIQSFIDKNLGFRIDSSCELC